MAIADCDNTVDIRVTGRLFYLYATVGVDATIIRKYLEYREKQERHQQEIELRG